MFWRLLLPSPAVLRRARAMVRRAGTRAPARPACTLAKCISTYRPCRFNETFGCEENGVWVHGIAAVFSVGGRSVLCGFPGMHPNRTYHCKAEQAATSGAPAEALPLPPCECERAGIRRACYAPLPSDKLACASGDKWAPSSCCRVAPKGGPCFAGWRQCAWHPEERIAWLHIPKAGTSFLYLLAHLANRSLPQSAIVPKEKKSRMEAEAFFKRWPPERYFRGSAIWWPSGPTHAAIGGYTWSEFRGRFFGMFRDPRERGWSTPRPHTQCTMYIHPRRVHLPSVHC